MREQAEREVQPWFRSGTQTRPDKPSGLRDGAVRVVPDTVPDEAAPDHLAHDHIRREKRAATPRVGYGSAVRVAFGLIWLVDAYFKWQPSFTKGLLGIMHDGAAGQPGWLTPWFNLSRAMVAVQPSVAAHGIAIVETGIAVALLLGLARKLTYVGGAVWSVLIWMTAEGFGRTGPGEVATDIGTAIVYAVVFLALLAADQRGVTRPYSLDAVIERRAHWWRHIAEVRR